jgi:GT2 family glycosyltransferase
MMSIVLINYKSEELTVRYIKEELFNLTLQTYIIIVNNDANNESNSYLQSKLHAVIVDNNFVISPEKIYILPISTNIGFAKANNVAVKFIHEKLGSKFILFSNIDIHINDKNIIEAMIKKMEEDEAIGMIGPKIVGLDGYCQSPEPYRSFLNKYCLMYLSTPFLSKEKKITRFKLDYSDKAKEGFQYKLMGSFFMVKTEDYIKCGMMDEHTFLYGEEVILSERMNFINKGVYYLPTVSVIHEHGKITGRHIKPLKRIFIQLKSETYYYHKYRHTPILILIIGNFIYYIICIINRK